MFMVVLVHYNADSMGKAFLYVTPGSLNYYFIYFIESLAIIGTNGFVLLTGYFSWKKGKLSFRKPVGLLLYVIAYNVAFYMINIVVLNIPFSVKTFIYSFIPKNWYITLYVALVAISPFLNRLIKSLSKKSCLTLLVLMFVIFSIWPTILDVANGKLGIDASGMYTVTMSSSGAGYSIVNFVMIYLAGAVISRFDLLKHHINYDIIAYFVFTCLILFNKLNCVQDGVMQVHLSSFHV